MLTLDGRQKLSHGLQGAVPLLLILLLCFLGMVPLGLTDFGTIAPPLGLLALFYWAVYRPDLVGPMAAFLAGFLTDALGGAPLGIHAFLFLVTYGMVVTQRQLFLAHSFFVLWWGFAVVAILTGAFSWLANAAIEGSFLPLRPLLFQALVGMALFPLVAGLCGRVQRLFLGEG